MKILALNTEKSWRGGEAQTLLNMEGLRRKSVEIILLASKDSELVKKSTQKGFEVIEVQNRWQALLFLIKHGQEFDLIHAQTSKTQLLAVLSKPFHQKPVVYSRRVNFEVKGWFSKLKYRATNQVIAITDIIKENLEKIGLKNVKVITDIIENQDINHRRAKQLIEENNWQNKKIIATVAALTSEKDPHTLVRAITHLYTIRQDFVFLHFGDGKLKTEIEKGINFLKISDIYQLLGHQNDVQDFYAVFDVFVLASKQEGLGSSILEAFVQRVPVVGTRAGGITETLENCGLLCEIGDAEGLAMAIDKLLIDKVLSEKLSQNAFEKANKKHSSETVCQAYFEVFEKLISE